MLKSLKIKNFKSFKDFKIELEKINCIIAPNNAGKSNLIEAIKFLYYAIDDVDKAIEEFGGFNSIKNVFLEDDLKFELDFIGEEFNISVINKNDIKNYSFNDLNIKANLEINNKQWNKTYRINGKVKISNNSNKKEIELKNEILQFNSKDENYVTIAEQDNDLANILKIMLLDHLKIYFFAYSFYPEIIKSSFKGGVSLRSDGNNLVEVLNFIQNNYKKKFEIISNSLIGIVEELNEIKIDKDLIGRNVLLLKEKNKFLPFNIVSDGTINLLAILTAIFEPAFKKMISFDEIEKHLHLRAIDYLLDVLKSKDFQVTFTTQSIEIINSLDITQDNLIFLYRDYEGFTKAISANKIPNFEKKVKRYNDIATIIRNEVLGYLGDFDEN